MGSVHTPGRSPDAGHWDSLGLAFLCTRRGGAELDAISTQTLPTLGDLTGLRGNLTDPSPTHVASQNNAEK